MKIVFLETIILKGILKAYYCLFCFENINKNHHLNSLFINYDIKKQKSSINQRKNCYENLFSSKVVKTNGSLLFLLNLFKYSNFKYMK